jgi:hypothetical protein
MKNRVVWGMVGVLATTLVSSAAGLTTYGRQTGAFTVRWIPLSDWRYWQVGKGQVVCAACGPYRSTGTLVGHEYSLGFIEIEVPYRGPNVVLWNTVRRPPKPTGKVKGSTRSGTGR